MLVLRSCIQTSSLSWLGLIGRTKLIRVTDDNGSFQSLNFSIPADVVLFSHNYKIVAWQGRLRNRG